MLEQIRRSRWTWLALGLTLGAVGAFAIARREPIPVHAVATHGQDNFAIATGFVDDRFEAVYFLDFLTGDLKAAVLGLRTGQFNSFYKYNVLNDFGGLNVKNPKFLLVTGVADFARSRGNFQMARSVVYVAEATSGQIACYGIPWNTSIAAQNKGQTGTFQRLDVKPFRTPVIRD